MNTAESSLPLRSLYRLAGLLSLAAVGIAVGWLIVPHHPRTFSYVHALVHPVGTAALCVSALHRRVRHSRWVVPLLLLGVMLDVAVAPHDFELAALGLAAGTGAIAASLIGSVRSAILASLLCCGAIAAALLVGPR